MTTEYEMDLSSFWLSLWLWGQNSVTLVDPGSNEQIPFFLRDLNLPLFEG